MNHTVEDLQNYWRTLFGDTPSRETLEVLVRFANLGPIYADQLLSLIVESGMVYFSSEGQRVLFIARKIAEQHDAEQVSLRAA